MKTIIWIIFLFAIAIGLAILGENGAGTVTIVALGHEVETSLNFFIVANVLFLFALSLLFKLVRVILRSPERFREGRRSRARRTLNLSALSFVEGRFKRSLAQSQKVLKVEGESHDKMLALMLSAQSADKIQNFPLRDEILAEIKKLPERVQLSRFLFEAEIYLRGDRLAEARDSLNRAEKLGADSPKILQRDLELSAKEKNSDKVLSLTDKLVKAGELDQSSADGYRVGAYKEQLAHLTGEKEIRKWTRGITDHLLIEDLSDEIALKFYRLGLNEDAINWVMNYYPQNKHNDLLNILVKTAEKLSTDRQQKILSEGEAWLKKDSADDANLLLCLGKIALSNQLWGKAQGYLEASISQQPSFEAHFTLAKLFIEIDKKDQAKRQTNEALALVEKNLGLES